MGFRNYDAFVKTRADLREQSVVGGVITMVAATTAALLFIGQVFFYVMGTTHHSLFLSRSTTVPLLPISGANIVDRLIEHKGKIPLSVHVTFPHLKCADLDLQHDGAALSTGEIDKIHGKHSIILRTPTAAEMKKSGHGHQSASKACTIQGQLHPQVVAGVLAIGMSRVGWSRATGVFSNVLRGDRSKSTMDALSAFNVTHYVHNIQFGDSFPLAADKPLENRLHKIENSYGGIAVEHIQLKLVPTLYQRFLLQDDTFQASVVRHTVHPQTLISRGVPYFPGLVIAYDFTPLAVHHSGGRDNFLVFLSSLVSIVGGTFVTVGLLTGCLVHSAQAVAKKID